MPVDIQALRKRRPRAHVIEKALERRKENVSLERFYGSEASLGFVVTRNLAGEKESLEGKRIAVLGCGAIGSHLARFLVQSGAGAGAPLLLVDNQRLTAANLGRHLLNFDDVGKPKASALAANLRRFHPEVEIKPVDADVSHVSERVSACDVLIDATGVETVSEFLNSRAIEARTAGHRLDLLHVWLFTNGIAAQTFLNAGDGFACYRCLRPELSSPWLYDPRKDVRDVGNVRAASCGEGPYLAFGVDAPVTAATQALRAVSDFLMKKPGPRLRTTAIDSQRARALKDASPSRHSRCPACGS